ncbi:MAG: hypothetical protein AB2801_08465 [Candidatus Thiodiazotropha endolucinida]
MGKVIRWTLLVLVAVVLPSFGGDDGGEDSSKLDLSTYISETGQNLKRNLTPIENSILEQDRKRWERYEQNKQREKEQLVRIAKLSGLLLIFVIVILLIVYRFIGKTGHSSKSPVLTTLSSFFWLVVPLFILIPAMYLFDKHVISFDGNVWVTLGFAAAIIRSYMFIWKELKQRAQQPKKEGFFTRKSVKAFLSGTAIWAIAVTLYVTVFEPFGRFDDEVLGKTVLIILGVPLVIVLGRSWHKKYVKQ